MTPQVFISYSSKDKAIADAVCHQLESAEVQCWMAPRDIEYGSDWTEGIMRGITACRVFVLVFSSNANSSGHVRREVAKAFSLGLHVIPFRIEDTLPQTSLSYFLETVHWLDAVTQPLEKHLTALTGRVKKLLANGTADPGMPPNVSKTVAYPGLASPTKRRQWVIGAVLAVAALAILATAWLYTVGERKSPLLSSASLALLPAKSVAVLPFECIGANKDDSYFADGVQDEILNNLAKIAQLKVISRTSVMQYRTDTRRDMRQIAYALGVANVLEGTVRRDGNRVRVSTQLVDARSDNAVWADSYDRDLTDIFTIQSEVAQTIAGKLSAALTPEEKQQIEARPTTNMEAYDMYVKAKEKVLNAQSAASGHQEQPIRDALSLLEKAVDLDPNFATAYCLMTFAYDALDLVWDPSSARHARGDQAIDKALRLQPDLPEVRLAYAQHLYRSLRDHERARAELAIARQGLPNSAEADYLEALMDRRQGRFESAIHHFNEAIKLDPNNTVVLTDLAETLSNMRQFSAAEPVWDRLIALVPDAPMAKARKEYYVNVLRTGDDAAYRLQIESLSKSIPDDKLVLAEDLNLALGRRDWELARHLLDRVRGGDGLLFRYGDIVAPVDCYSILLSRLQGQQPDAQVGSGTRQLLSRRVDASPTNAIVLSNLAVVDALLGHNDDAISEGERAADLLPISKDAVDGPLVAMNLGVVYAWTDHPDLAFQQLDSLSKVPFGLFRNHLKLESYFDPLRKDPRYHRLLEALAPH